MKKYDFLRKGAPRPSAGQLSDTKLFYRNCGEIYARFDDWKDIDRFYFIPLWLEMYYSCGWAMEMAPDPVWLGSFVRCSLEHPELFRYACPGCGRPVLPFRYTGSPLSGHVILEGNCACGWRGFESVSGWAVRATALRDRVAADSLRHAATSAGPATDQHRPAVVCAGPAADRHRPATASTVRDLLAWLGANR